jgi:hypothetical protein
MSKRRDITGYYRTGGVHWHPSIPAAVAEGVMEATHTMLSGKRGGRPYGRAVLAGGRSWTGADVVGRAGSYGGHYAGQREEVIDTLAGQVLAAETLASCVVERVATTDRGRIAVIVRPAEEVRP